MLHCAKTGQFSLNPTPQHPYGAITSSMQQSGQLYATRAPMNTIQSPKTTNYQALSYLSLVWIHFSSPSSASASATLISSTASCYLTSPSSAPLYRLRLPSIDFHRICFHQVFWPVHHLLIHYHSSMAASCQLQLASLYDPTPRYPQCLTTGTVALLLKVLADIASPYQERLKCHTVNNFAFMVNDGAQVSH